MWLDELNWYGGRRRRLRGGDDGASRCIDCGHRLTADEIKYYEFRCEGCEGIWFIRMQEARR